MTPIVTLQAITQSPRAHLAGSGHQARPYRKTTFESHSRVLTAKLLGRGAGTFEEHREDPGHEVGFGCLRPSWGPPETLPAFCRLDFHSIPHPCYNSHSKTLWSQTEKLITEYFPLIKSVLVSTKDHAFGIILYFLSWELKWIKHTISLKSVITWLLSDLSKNRILINETKQYTNREHLLKWGPCH